MNTFKDDFGHQDNPDEQMKTNSLCKITLFDTEKFLTQCKVIGNCFAN